MENTNFFKKVQPVLGSVASLFIIIFALYHSYVYLKLISSESYGSNLTCICDISLVQGVLVACTCYIIAVYSIHGGRQQGQSDGGVPPKPNETGDN